MPHQPNGESARQQRRRLERYFRARGADLVSAEKTGYGHTFSLLFTKPDLLDLLLGVNSAVLGTPKDALIKLQFRIQRSNSLFTAVQKTLDSLLQFPSDKDYTSLVSAAATEARECWQAQHDCLSDQFAASLECTALPPQRELAKVFMEQQAKKMRVPAAQVKIRDINAMLESYCSDMAQLKDAVRKNKVVFSQRLSFADALKSLLESVERVSTEGSPKTAYLYLTRMARILVPENDENRVQQIFNNIRSLPFVYLKNSLFRFFRLHDRFEGAYIGIAGNSLDSLLLALDQEERRERHSSRVRHINTHLLYFIETPDDVTKFSEALEKAGAKADSAAELLGEVPIGQRKSVFKALKRDPVLVGLYEQLKVHGVDARSYILFATDLAKVEVELHGEKRTLQAIVGEIADNEAHRSGAAWLVRHPDVWARTDLPQVLGLAGTDCAGMKLELYSRWNSNPVKSGIVIKLVPELSANDVSRLAAALPKISGEKLEIIPQLTLDGVLLLQEPDELRAEDSPSKPGKTQKRPDTERIMWPNLAYRGNQELIDAALKAYEAVPLHLRHRIKQVDVYVREHWKSGEREGTLLRYFSQISSSSPEMLRHVFANDSFFESFLERVIKKGAVDKRFVDQLETIVHDNSNPYGHLHDTLISDSKNTSSKMIHFALGRRLATPDVQKIGEHAAGEGNAVVEGVVYRLAIFGNFENRKELTRKVTQLLAGTGIEPVFVSPKNKGEPPDCDGMLIVTGRNTPHSAPRRGHYEETVPVMTMSGHGIKAIVTSAIGFRNRLYGGSFNA